MPEHENDDDQHTQHECTCWHYCRGKKLVTFQTWVQHQPYRLQVRSLREYLQNQNREQPVAGPSNRIRDTGRAKTTLTRQRRKRRRVDVESDSSDESTGDHETRDVPDQPGNENDGGPAQDEQPMDLDDVPPPPLPDPQPGPLPQGDNDENIPDGGPATDPAEAREPPIPEVRRDDLKKTLEYIELLKHATIANSRMSKKDQDRLKNPPNQEFRIDDPPVRLSVDLFVATSNGSNETYNAIRDALLQFSPEMKVLSLYKVQSFIRKATGIAEVVDDMCVNSCMAYTGPYEKETVCPYCEEPRYKPIVNDSSPLTPRQTFTTLVPGPQIQSLMRTPELAEEMSYLYRAAHALIARTLRGSAPAEYTDVYSGSELMEAFASGTIGPDDVVLVFSIDGAQLYRNKMSDCWVYVWIIENLSPDKRFKRRYVMPGAVIPGPKHPENLDSFIFTGLYHVSALMNDGLTVWNASSRTYRVCRPFIPGPLADGPAMSLMQGMVGHHGALGCLIYCGLPGRHKTGCPHYYPVLKRPLGRVPAGSDHRDIELHEIPLPSPALYLQNLAHVLAAENDNRYFDLRKATGITKPSLWSGLSRMVTPPNCYSMDWMHTRDINYFDLMLDIWRGTITGSRVLGAAKTWDCAVLQGEVWDNHGVEVQRATPYLPGFFERAPRNIALKMNSGYKAIEKHNYMYGYGPNMLRRLLPANCWDQYCKTVRAVRLLSKYTITAAELVEARTLLDEATVLYEDIYYGRDIDKLHVVRPVVHKIWHAPDQVVTKGSLICRTQYPMERAFSILLPQVKQHSNSFANLSARAAREVSIQALMALLPGLDRHQDPRRLPRGAEALGDDYDLLRARERKASACTPAENAAFFDYFSRVDPGALHGRTREAFSLKLRRWARLRLPNNQVARSAWKECQKPLCRLRMARCVKFSDDDGNVHVGEVKYFSFLQRRQSAVAVVSVFGLRDEALFRLSSRTIELMEHRDEDAIRVIDVKSIQSVVGMIPDVVVSEDEYLNDHRHLHGGRKYFVMEKLGYAVALGSRDPEMDIDE